MQQMHRSLSPPYPRILLAARVAGVQVPEAHQACAAAAAHAPYHHLGEFLRLQGGCCRSTSSPPATTTRPPSRGAGSQRAALAYASSTRRPSPRSRPARASASTCCSTTTSCATARHYSQRARCRCCSSTRITRASHAPRVCVQSAAGPSSRPWSRSCNAPSASWRRRTS